MNEKKAMKILRLMGILSFFLLFGIVYGPKHPQIFFWGTIISCTAIIFNLTAITKKQFAILAFCLVGLAFTGEKINLAVTNWFGNYSLLSLIANYILLAPFYIPVAMYFFHICTQGNGKR